EARFSVTALDAYGNTTPSYQGTVHVTSSDPAAVLPDDTTFDYSWIQLSAILRTVGTQSITVTDPANPSITGTQTGILVLPAASTSDVTVTEGNTGTRAATFTVTLSAALSQTVTIGYATANGTAAASGDFVAASDTLTFTPGQTRKTVTVL